VDLDRIQEAFLRTLVSMYHHRVEYPGFDFRKDRGPTVRENGQDHDAEAEEPAAEVQAAGSEGAGAS